jgi:hypothetical protein
MPNSEKMRYLISRVINNFVIYDYENDFVFFEFDDRINETKVKNKIAE